MLFDESLINRQHNEFLIYQPELSACNC